jgi:hypothetical protein
MSLRSYNLRATKNEINQPNVALTITKKTILCGVELSQIGMHCCPSMILSTLASELIPCEECICKGSKNSKLPPSLL